MNDLHDDILRIESVLYELNTDPSNLSNARRIISDSLQNLAQIAPDSSLSLADTFEAIAKGCNDNMKRDMGLISIRLVSCTDVLTTDDINKGRRHIVRLIEEGCPDLISKVFPDKNAPNHKKIQWAKTIHHTACKHLSYLQQPFTSVQDLWGRRQTILTELNHGPTKSYLNAFGFDPVRSSVSSLLKLVDGLAQSQGHKLQASMQCLLESIADELNQYANTPTFIVQEYMLPFLLQAQTAARAQQETMADKFACIISVPVSPFEIEKKYPLHVTDSEIQIFIPLTNEGPGVAQNVRATCVADHCEIQSEETSLGDVEPGSFVLTLIVNVTEPRESLELEVEIQWGVIGDPSNHTRTFSVTAKGQRNDLNWDDLSRQQPYSLEVAHDQEFYGRKDAVQRILRRLASDSMQSCYITGQKRVGKSSLARAVETKIKNNIHPGDYNVLYLECGEIRHSSGEDTLKELGTQLERFLAENLPQSAGWLSEDFSSSLIPLNSLLDQLRTQKPESRFVVILDEFDEINESLYRYGELANTFFLNLRTLSSKSNIAFVLVGAERMPYVMASQGEKLNKFNRESLDSFSLQTEWGDYRALIQTPVENVIKLHEPALRKLFELTDGHPYFTKMLCAKVYECAVETKDAEISSAEVEKAAEQVVATLDTNAFAHYWRDGIRGDSNDIEIVSIKRCRLFMAWARTARSKKPLTHESIGANVLSGVFNTTEVLPLLEDLCRRRVFREKNGAYLPAVDLFAVWLRESGFSMLVSDQLGDELAEAKQHREDIAYVRATEIVDVANKWDLYQGRQITEDKIRAWIEQVESNIERRWLLKLLQNVRFVSDLETRKKLSEAHRWIRGKLPVPVQKSRSQHRDDILVSYVDGPGKSGALYAELYARTNEIRSENVVTPLQLDDVVGNKYDGKHIGLVIVDDMIGTGHNLVEKLTELSDLFQQVKVGTEVPLSVIVLCSTVEGEYRVRAHLNKSMPNADLEICETLESKHFAFTSSIGFWESKEEMSAAKTLLRDLGVRVQKRTPLGFKDQGLLLTFSRNCPNNSLPILHGSGKGGAQWMPLFPRSKT